MDTTVSTHDNEIKNLKERLACCKADNKQLLYEIKILEHTISELRKENNKLRQSSKYNLPGQR